MQQLIKPGGEYLFTHHKRQTLWFFVILCLILMIGVLSGYKIEKSIMINYVDNASRFGGPCRSYSVNSTLMSTVAEVLEKEHIQLGENQVLGDESTTLVKDLDQITIISKIKGVIKVDGKDIAFDSGAQTVGNLLKECKVSLGVNDEVIPCLHAMIAKDQNRVTVTRITYDVKGSYRDVPFETVSQENDELDLGTENVLTAGIKGIETILERVMYRDGVASGRETIMKKTLVSPVTEVKEIGTKNPYGGSTGNATAAIGDEMDFICAIVAQEGGMSYDGALGVISCIMNRVDSGAWGGSSVVDVITAPGQFSAYWDGAYEKYLGANMPEVERAVTDCMEKGIRNTSAQSFRGYPVDGAMQIGGNYFF